jgi:hypothetical protein
MIRIAKKVHDVLVKTASKGDTRFALNGVFVEEHGGRVYLVSSDSHRLTVYSPDPESVGDEVLSFFGDWTTEVEDAKGKKSSIQRHGRLLTMEAFKARSGCGIKRGGRRGAYPILTVDLAGICASEMIDGQFPRWRDVFPNGLMRPMIRHDSESTTLADDLSVNMKYVFDAEPILEHNGDHTLRSTKEGQPLCAESGPRPWKDGAKAKDAYVGHIIMPADVKDLRVPRMRGFPREDNMPCPKCGVRAFKLDGGGEIVCADCGALWFGRAK